MTPALPLGLRRHLPAAAVPGDGGGELRREPPRHRLLALPALHAAHVALRAAAGGGRRRRAAGGVEPRPLHAAAAAPLRPRGAGDAASSSAASAPPPRWSSSRPSRSPPWSRTTSSRRWRCGVLAVQGVERSGDVKRMLLATRRVAMVLILGLGYVYFRASGRSDALAATGLIAFCGVAQFLPALIAGIFWRNATKRRRHRRDGRRLRPLGLYPLPAELRRRLPPVGRHDRQWPLRHRRAAPLRALRQRRRRPPGARHRLEPRRQHRGADRSSRSARA